MVASTPIASIARTDDNGKVIDMTEPQVWVLIGVFATAIFGMLTWQTISFNRALKASIDGLAARIDGRFAAVDAKLDGLDRDVQALTRHVFGTDPR
jgi:hypothetical protein